MANCLTRRTGDENHQVVVGKIHVLFESQSEAFSERDYVSFVRAFSTLSTNV